MKLNLFRTSCFLVAACLLTAWSPMRVLADGSDDFNDNDKDTSKWGNDVVTGGFGVLDEKNGRLEFTVNNPLTDGDTLRPWILTRMPVNADWSIQVDTVNSTSPAFGQVNSGGFTLLHPTRDNTEIYHELYAVSGGKGFVSALETDGTDIANIDTSAYLGGPVMGAVRMEYNAVDRVITCFYDEDISDGYQWTQNASFGLNNAGGGDANTDWNLSNDQQFSVWVYGYSELMTIASGTLYLDNFSETGGVLSGGGGGPSPVPTGNFSFGFPSGIPGLAAIASIIGNYTGTDPFGSTRNYNIDVAQDDSGKVASMGTVDGITNDEGGPDLMGPPGAVTTVNNEPTLSLKGGFSGASDGTPGSFKGTASGPAELTDIGGGTNGLALTATGSGESDGVPQTLNNAPVVIPSTPDMEANFGKKNWILTLTINNTVVNGKDVTTATAELTLPNGDVVQYPERKVKYSPTKGYKLKFKKGTNVTADPPLATKSSISITGLTFTQMGEDWDPSGGIIAYRFLGQQGIGNLLDFTGP